MTFRTVDNRGKKTNNRGKNGSKYTEEEKRVLAQRYLEQKTATRQGLKQLQLNLIHHAGIRLTDLAFWVLLAGGLSMIGVAAAKALMRVL